MNLPLIIKIIWIPDNSNNKNHKINNNRKI